MNEQIVHYKACQMSTMRRFYISFVYGHNKEGERKKL